MLKKHLAKCLINISYYYQVVVLSSYIIIIQRSYIQTQVHYSNINQFLLSGSTAPPAISEPGLSQQLLNQFCLQLLTYASQPTHAKKSILLKSNSNDGVIALLTHHLQVRFKFLFLHGLWFQLKPVMPFFTHEVLLHCLCLQWPPSPPYPPWLCLTALCQTFSMTQSYFSHEPFPTTSKETGQLLPLNLFDLYFLNNYF